MSIRNISLGGLVAIGLWVGPVAAMAASVVLQGDTWDSIKALPDWSGSWQAITWLQQVGHYGRGPYDVDAPLNPIGAKELAVLKKISDAGGDVPTRSYHCIPLGFPGSMDGPAAQLAFAYAPGEITVTDSSGFIRRIYTDGRAHNDNFTTFEGDSIGHWESGGVLVVDTRDLDPGDEFILGLPQGNGVHVIERIHLAGPGILKDDLTFYAPDLLVKPWVHSITYRHSNDPVFESDCAQNNRDLNPVTGTQRFDLTAPQ